MYVHLFWTFTAHIFSLILFKNLEFSKIQIQLTLKTVSDILVNMMKSVQFIYRAYANDEGLNHNLVKNLYILYIDYNLFNKYTDWPRSDFELELAFFARMQHERFYFKAGLISACPLWNLGRNKPLFVQISISLLIAIFCWEYISFKLPLCELLQGKIITVINK